MPLIVGAAFLLLLLMLGRAYVGTDARSLGKAVRMAGAALLALLALFIAVRGQIGFAIFLGLTSWAVATGGEMPWKKNTSFGAGPGQAPPQAPQPPGGMSRQEALKVLGLEPSATKDEIRAAHRRLILQNHPDKGGTTYLAAKINQAKDVLLDDRLMRVHIFDQQLGRGPGHPPICDGLVAEALRRRGIETILYGAIAPSDHTPPVDDAVPTFRGTMWDHVGRDALTWPLEDYVQLGEQTAADLVALGAERFANDDIAFFPNLSQNEIGGIRSWVQTLPEDNRPILILKFSVLTWATPRFQDYRNKNLIPLLYRFGMKGLLAAHPRTVLCTNSEEMAAAFRNVAELTLPVLPLPLFIDPPKERAAEHLTVAYLGYASPWKGFQLLPQIVSEFGKSAPQANGRNVRFIFQSFGDEKLCAEVEGALAGNEAVTFIRGDVSRERYVGLVQEADILLMPYAAMIYGWASSGVFTEGLSAGKIAVVPEQTWQARQLTQYQAGGTTFATQEPAPIAAALRQAVTEYDALRAKADAARTPWKARHNPESFVDQMLSLAAMVAR